MAIERLKFRCYRCNQLLGATPNKAGSVVSCPKCNAELLIPVPDLPGGQGPEPDARVPAPPPAPAQSQAKIRPVERLPSESDLTAAPERTTSATAVKNVPRPTRSPAYPDELAAALPPDLIDLRPEDLRVEAEFFESLTRQPPVAAEPAPWPTAPEFAPSFANEAYVSPSPPAATLESINTTAPPAVVPSYLTETLDLTLPKPSQTPVKAPAAATSEAPLIGTAIEIEHPTILPPGSEQRRITEVVLPASAVLSFSLFALLGIALSFVAGLLMGHFIWTAH